ncbi:MAG TPA: ATP-binding cassette domain-containing protein [Chlamydiales bacterium]|nr:ATP-binding cassette domain-containing protein [Chlamydiales bacterium]
MIEVVDLWKSYGKNQILSGMNLKIHEGEILVILGRSGVGKSVLLRHIIGIEKPDKGYIDVDGVRISELSKTGLYKVVKDMGMLFQGAALFDSMNIFENTAFYLRQHGNPKTKEPYTEEEIRDKVFTALKMVSLEGQEKKLPSDLSGGMRKRAGLARLIVYRPRILLYDEPTTGLDPITAQQINELIVQVQEELKGTSVVVTHDLHSALYMADRIALHRDGKIDHIEETQTFLNIEDPLICFLKDSLLHHPSGRTK